MFDLFCAALTTICELVLPLIATSITRRATTDLASLTIAFVLKLGGLYLVLRAIDAAANYYMQSVVKLCYAIAGVVAVVGAISVYIAMNNEEQDVKKKIMMVVGACIFLVAAAQALPLFFGL